MSVPQTPTAMASTSKVSGASGGSGISSRRALSATPGKVVMARIGTALFTTFRGPCARHPQIAK